MSILRNIIEEAKGLHGKPLKDLTVLAAQRDPYRLDTPANHDLGQWLRDAYDEVNAEGRRLHLRGLHYALVGRVELPNGKPYKNDDQTWLWLADKAAKAARYLGYLSWDALRDARNSPPRVFTPKSEDPFWWLSVGSVELELPTTLEPQMRLGGDLSIKPCRQVVIAEKQGVEDVLLPVCSHRDATLALPAGEISDTMVYELLRDAAKDGRPMVIHQLGDFDPAGNQMAVSTARTAQAIRDSQFPDLDLTVHAVALTRDQCEAWNLPSTPLKETERRADRWVAAMGWEQTELDAAVALSPNELADAIDDSLLQYYDDSLYMRDLNRRHRLLDEANANLKAHLGQERLDAIRTEAESKFDELQDLVDQVNDALRINPRAVGIEMPETPEVEIGDTACRYPPLIDPTMDWAEATGNLIKRKKY